MEAIKILRLNTGEDIICYMEHYGADEIVVREPMMVAVNLNGKTGKQTVMLDHWLPIQIIKQNEAIIKEKDILASFLPSVEFSEYFENAVIAIQEAKKSKKEDVSSSDDDDLTQVEMNVLLDWMDTGPKHLH